MAAVLGARTQHVMWRRDSELPRTAHRAPRATLRDARSRNSQSIARRGGANAAGEVEPPAVGRIQARLCLCGRALLTGSEVAGSEAGRRARDITNTSRARRRKQFPPSIESNLRLIIMSFGKVSTAGVHDAMDFHARPLNLVTLANAPRRRSSSTTATSSPKSASAPGSRSRERSRPLCSRQSRLATATSTVPR